MAQPMMTQSANNHADVLPPLTINDREVSWTEVLGCMQLFGKLKPFLQAFVSQYVLLEEINHRDDLTVEPTDLLQAVMNFRVTRNLTEQADFQSWLASEYLDNATFQRRIALEMKMTLLKERLTAPNLDAYFEAHRESFTELKFSCLVMKDEEIAHRLGAKLESGDCDFQTIAAEYAADGVGYRQQQVQIKAFPSAIRGQMCSAAVGDRVGPVFVNEVWSIFRVDERVSADLNEKVRDQIQTQLFAQWLKEKLKHLEVGIVSPDESDDVSNL
ncbi:MAG: hypothetical protein AAFN38_20755 [Cyanobacteria bacterium J06560_5]